MEKFSIRKIIYWAIMVAVAIAYYAYFDLGWSVQMANISRILDASLKSVAVFVLASGVSGIIAFVVAHLGGATKKGKTVSKLLASMSKYAVAIVALVVVLGYFIEDTTTLITGLSMLTLIVGLGMTNLISDIVAGIFIVFEGDYQVGDVVVIDGWRGKVNEIGIRTTKIEDIGGNVQIINNSNISKIINNSSASSFASCTVGVEYDQSLEKVESVLAKLLPEIGGKYESVLEGPYYKGVSELADSSVNLLIVAKCREEDKFQLQRDLNRELKLGFDKNNISIPFPQVTLSYLKEESAHSSLYQKLVADKFNQEQREKSKGVNESENN